MYFKLRLRRDGYFATTALGVRFPVSRTQGVMYALSLPPGGAKRWWANPIVGNVPAEQARSIKADVALMVVGRFAEPYLTIRKREDYPTISRSLDTDVETLEFGFDPVCAALYEKSAARVVAFAKIETAPWPPSCIEGCRSPGRLDLGTQGLAWQDEALPSIENKARSGEFYAYFAYMYDSVRANWKWSGSRNATMATTIRFGILPDGRFASIRIVEKSSSAEFDEAVLAAFRVTRSLSPPPPAIAADFADVEFVFRGADTERP